MIHFNVLNYSVYYKLHIIVYYAIVYYIISNSCQEKDPHQILSFMKKYRAEAAAAIALAASYNII